MTLIARCAAARSPLPAISSTRPRIRGLAQLRKRAKRAATAPTQPALKSAAAPQLEIERVIFPDAFTHLLSRLPHITVDELVSDSAIGYAPCLNLIYNAGVIPTVDIRHDQTDEEEDTCIARGYDEHGHPLCAHGYPMAFNGVDYSLLQSHFPLPTGSQFPLSAHHLTPPRILEIAARSQPQKRPQKPLNPQVLQLGSHIGQQDEVPPYHYR